MCARAGIAGCGCFDVCVRVNACVRAQVSPDVVALLTTREETAEMLKMKEYIDLIIPRGSNEFVQVCVCSCACACALVDVRAVCVCCVCVRVSVCFTYGVACVCVSRP